MHKYVSNHYQFRINCWISELHLDLIMEKELNFVVFPIFHTFLDRISRQCIKTNMQLNLKLYIKTGFRFWIETKLTQLGTIKEVQFLQLDKKSGKHDFLLKQSFPDLKKSVMISPGVYTFMTHCQKWLHFFSDNIMVQHHCVQKPNFSISVL